ncbi:hypothetical protein Poli38472_008423 [Pythium oligandrum]|uniref:VPS9 domain-containing protein n=1 Tax=Pythium oligandrum TaxID=41045 RepID=A0A8K1CLE3_PYTOL|nr:hypothetical protein Poli38472_008423 [Pythium oligandrum]|eukprot:TMW65781.1 hypothetical protein Poli38472_008423 [Pythium oligandrum]
MSSMESPTRERDVYEELRCENGELRRQVADLSGALKARDLEIAALQERCRFLQMTMEQQDETIAKIYAVATPETLKVLQESTEKHDTTSSSMRFDEVDVKKEETPAVGLLDAAIERLLKLPPPPPATHIFAEKKKRPSLFDDIDNEEEEENQQLGMSSPTLSSFSKSSSSRSLERRESCTSEEDFVKSAGFLRRQPSRRTSGRLSITEFGLLDDLDDEEEEEHEQDEDNQDAEVDLQTESELDGDKQRRLRSTSVASTRSGRQRKLFAEIDRVSALKARKAKPQDNQEGESEQEMTYAEFLERLRLPASRDILETIRMFLDSILGPRGDGSPPRASDYIEYDFYGHHEFRRRCEYFVQSMHEMLLNHPVWCHASEATLATARDGIEKYVMDKLSDIAMNQLDECIHWKEEDERLLQRMKALSFITPDMLDIKPCMRNEVVWSMAEDELRRINSFRSPGDKINCIVRCCSIIFSVLNLARGDSANRPGADDFLPVFIYIVLQSKIPRLYSNCEYIAAYRNSADLMSKAGYCFVNLRSAIEFIMVVDASMLSVSEQDFERLYAKERHRL